MPEIKFITRSDHSAWDSHVLSGKHCGPYLTTAWKTAVEKAYGHKTFYLAAYSGNSVSGVLPLVSIKPPLAGGVLVSLPFCDYGGIVADNRDTAEALLQRATGLADKLHAALEIRSPETCAVIEQKGRFINVSEKCRMVLALPEDSALLWSGFKSKLRSQVKRAAKDGLAAHLGGGEMLDDFYRVFSRNMRDLGSPVHSFKWIQTVVDAFGAKAKTVVVYKDDLPVGAGIILMDENTATVPWASTIREFNRLSPNMLLYWTFLEYAADHGYRSFDFGRSTPGEGTYSFKKQWGAKPAPLYWYMYNGKPAFRNSTAQNGAFRKTVEGIWQRLPLQAANTLGPHLRKYISR